MKKIYTVLLLGTILITLSCSSLKKEKYNVINEALADNEFNSLAYQFFTDTIYSEKKIALVRKDIYPLNNIGYYSLNWDIKIDTINKVIPMFSIGWVDKSKKIILEQPDITEIRRQIETATTFQFWEQSKINNKNRFIVIDNDTLYSNKCAYNIFNCKKNILVYHFTEPVINIKRDVAVFGFHCYTNSSKYNSSFLHGMAIMKKEKNKWKYLGYMSGTEID